MPVKWCHNTKSYLAFSVSFCHSIRPHTQPMPGTNRLHTYSNTYSAQYPLRQCYMCLYVYMHKICHKISYGSKYYRYSSNLTIFAHLFLLVRTSPALVCGKPSSIHNETFSLSPTNCDCVCLSVNWWVLTGC